MNADREIFIFPVHLTTCRTGNLTRLIHTLAICVTIHRGKTWHKRKDFVLLGCGTYFIEDNIIQYNTVQSVIICDNALHPLFTPDPCDYSRGLPSRPSEHPPDRLECQNV